ASWGGVYAVGLLIVAFNSALALVVFQRETKTIAAAGSTVFIVTLLISLSYLASLPKAVDSSSNQTYLNVVGVQPNVPMTPVKSSAETEELLDRHLWISINGLRAFGDDQQPRLVIWPESPTNF